MKKISVLLAATIALSTIGNAAFVDAKLAQTSNAVFYSDFENVSVFDTGSNVTTSTFDEDYGKSYSIADTQTNGNWTKTFDNDITGGVMTFSFDTYYTSKEKFVDMISFSTANEWNQKTPYRVYIAWKNGKLGLTTGEDKWDLVGGGCDYQINQWYHIDIVLDLNKTSPSNSYLKMYVNGELKSSTQTQGSFAFPLKAVHGFTYTVENGNGELGAHYVDNIMATTNNDNNLTVAKDYQNGYTDLTFSETIPNLNTFTTSDVTLTKNSAALAVTAVKNIGYRTLRVFHEGALSDKTNYSIKFNKNPTSILGKILVSDTIVNEYVPINAGKLPSNYILNSNFENTSAFTTIENVQTSVFDADFGKSYSIVDWQPVGKWTKTLDTPVTSGVVTISFDSYYTEKTKFNDVMEVLAKNEWNPNTKYNTYMAFGGGNLGIANGEGSWDLVGGGFNYQAGQWYHIDYVLDLNNTNPAKTTYKLYVNGELKATRTEGHLMQAVNSIAFRSENKNADVGAHYIDNMRIVTNNADDFKAGVTFEEGASNIVLTESVANLTSLTTNDITLTKNGVNVPITGIRALSNQDIRITYNGYISDNDVYQVTLPQNLTGILGNTLKNNVITNLVTLTSIKTKDSNGNVADLTQTMPSDIKEISLYLDGYVEKTALDNALTLTTGGNRADYTTSYDSQNNVYTISLPKYLKANSEYTLEIVQGASIPPISKRFTTGEGIIKAVKLAFYQGTQEIKNLSDVTGSVTLRAEIINTTGVEKKYSLSYGIYNGTLMSAVDFNEGTVAADAFTSTKEFTFTPDKTSGNVVKGYVWNGVATMVPYSDTWAELK